MESEQLRKSLSGVILFGAVAIATIIGIVFSTPETPFVPPLADYGRNQKVAEESTLILAFPEAMNQASVAENLEAPKGVTGKIGWNEKVMTFTPGHKLKMGQKYTFRVNKNAKVAKGKPLGQDLEYHFTVAGEPKISTFLPVADAKAIPTDAKITLIFDRPMIALSAVQGSDVKKYNGEWPVKITPRTEGIWRWLSTTTVQFKPASPLTEATAYKVDIPAGVKTLTGDTTKEKLSWSFETVRPEITGSDLGEGFTFAGPTSTVTLSTNTVIDLKNAAEKMELVKADPKNDKNNEIVPVKIDYTLEKKAEGEKAEINQKKLTVTPQSELSRSSQYRLTVKSGLKGIVGDLGTENPFTLNFSTVGDLAVKRGIRNGNGLQIDFTNPLENATVKGQITITPTVKGWEDLKWEGYSNFDGESAYWMTTVYPDLKPSTNYTVTVQAGVLADSFGQKLKEPYSFSFKTEELPPNVSILSKGEFAIFEKNRPPLYPFQVMNVSALNLALARLPFGEFLKIRREWFKNSNHEPSLENLPEYQKSTVPVRNPVNTGAIINIDTAKEFKKTFAPGIYILSSESPEFKYSYGEKINQPIVQYQYFSLTNIALTLKYSSGKVLIWAVDMETGKPVSAAELNFYSVTGEKRISGRTDTNGFFESPFDLKQFDFEKRQDWNPEFWVTATKGNDFAFISSHWQNGLESWNFGVGEDFGNLYGPPDRLDSYVYTERQVYRPGDTVYFKDIVRIRDVNGALSIPKAGTGVLVKIMDANGTQVFSKNLRLNEWGSLSGELPLSKDASLGYYSIMTTLLPENKVDRNYAGGSPSFAVLEYRKPEYKVEVTPEKESYMNDDRVGFKVNAHYYFGAPMSEAKVHWYASSNDYFFYPPQLDPGEWYSFSTDDACGWSCSATNKNLNDSEGQLDANGSGRIEFPVNLNEKELSQIVTMEASVTDLNNQTVSERASVPVHRSSVYVGLRTDDYVVTPGQKAVVKVIALTPEGKAVGNQNVRVKLFSRVWNTIKKKSVDGEYYYDNEPKDTFIRETKVNTDEKGKGVGELLIHEGGSYVLVAETKDSKGRLSRAATQIYGFSKTYINWPHTNNDRIDVLADKPEYKIGDTAKILIKSPYQGEGVRALITIERENVLKREVVDIKSNAQSVDIPITTDLIPNAYVSVVVIKPRKGSTFDENGKDTGAPAFKMGYAQLQIETSSKRLSVELATDRPKYGPGESVNLSIKTKDGEGKGVPTEISIGVVDLSLQALLGFYLPDLTQQFYANRGLGVRTAQMLLYLIETFKPGTKGGGGGPETKVRGNFKDTAYWNPSVVTNEQGEATLTFKLPDNLTTWQVVAIAQSKDHRFGSKETTFIETKKTIVRPVRPRFAVRGDQMELGAVVHNFLETKQTYRVSLKGSGFESKGSMEHSLTLEPNENKKMLFKIQITDSKKATFHFKAESDEAIDEVEESIPIHLFGTPQSVATSGVIENGSVTETIYVPPRNEASEGSVLTTLSPTLAAFLPKGLEYVTHFPYGCAEQTVSGFLPNVAIAALQGFDAFKIVDNKTLEKNIVSGLQQLYNLQRGDGGFGYFAESSQSYAYLTAYIVYALEMTEKAGHAVDRSVLDRANDYLALTLRDQNLNNEIDLITRAYILYVLGEGGHSDSGLLSNLYENRKSLPLFAKAHLVLALRHDSGESAEKKSKKVLEEILNNVKINSRGAFFEEKNGGHYRFAMNTDTRTTALILQALLRVSPRHDLIPQIVRHLLAVREQGHWDTTQSTVSTIFALIEFLQNTGELQANFTSKMSIDGKTFATAKFAAKNILTKKEVKVALTELKPEAMNPVVISKDNGTGRVYYDILMSYFLTLDTLPPADEGISIARTMTPLKGTKKEKKTPVTDAKLLETYKVKLTITVPENRHFVGVESPLPAGFEAIDFSLNTSQQGLQSDLEANQKSWWDWSNQQWRFSHIEFRDDRVFLFAEALPAGVYEYEYLVRASTPGRFRYRPARAWEMYFPETFGQTEGVWMEVEN